MPLYEYYCPNCKSTFELLVNHQHADDIVCMRCHSEKVRRLLSIFAAQHSSNKGSNCEGISSCACGNGGCGCN